MMGFSLTITVRRLYIVSDEELAADRARRSARCRRGEQPPPCGGRAKLSTCGNTIDDPAWRSDLLPRVPLAFLPGEILAW